MSIAQLIATTGPINGLTDDEKYAFNECWKVWTQKLRRNLLRATYYDQHNVLKDLEIAIPPHLTDLELVLGWPSKAVDTLARRCKLDGFVIPGAEDDPFGVKDVWRSNDMHIELPQTLTSAFVHSCAFLTVTKGDPGMGEPEVLVSSQSALFAAGVWDSRRRRLKYAMTITDMDEVGGDVRTIVSNVGQLHKRMDKVEGLINDLTEVIMKGQHPDNATLDGRRRRTGGSSSRGSG